MAKTGTITTHIAGCLERDGGVQRKAQDVLGNDMLPSPAVTLIVLLALCSNSTAQEPYEIKNIGLGDNLLETYLALKSRYGDAVTVKKWRRHGAETISLIANRDDCGSKHRRTCEQMTVSSVLPLYRERVVRIELKQTFIRRRTEKELVDSLVQKYGQPYVARLDTQRRSSARTLVWCAHSRVPPARVRDADSWVEYRALKASFVATWFNIEQDGKVSGVNFVAENHDMREKNKRSMLGDTHRFKRALIREELRF